MTVGEELKQARETAGLSAEQVSDRTKIQLYKIEALESDDFEKLPQGIYLDGIVRAYAHEVGIDTEPMVERVRVQRGTLPGDWEVPFGPPIDLHGPASHPASRNDAEIDDIPVLDVPDGGDPLDSFASEGSFSAEKDTTSAIAPARAVSRRVRLALPIVALLGAVGFGLYFYQIGRPRHEPAPHSENAVTQDTSPRAAQSPVPAPPVPQPIESAAPRDVTGSWRLATHVESSSLARYEGLRLGYAMQLEQNGDRVSGRGRKITENGAGIRARAQTPVTVSGTIDGDRLTLNFVERGTRRPTEGKFVLFVDDSGTLRGRFSSSAARSSGRVEAHRVTTQ